MKKKSTSQSAFFNLRILTASVFCVLGIAVALFAQGNRTKQAQTSRSGRAQAAPGTQTPDVVQMVGPVIMTTNLRDLPYIPNEGEKDEQPLTRYPHPKTGAPAGAGPSAYAQFQSLLKKVFRPAPAMPPPLLTFDGINSSQSGCGCLPPDTDGDVGPNHYVEAVNSSFRVYDKSGTPLSPPTTYNSFFSSLTGTPCQNANDGDPFAFYDHQADRWVISDFAFPAFPGTSFWQCIGVSQSPDPVAGPWALYAIQIDPANNNQLGDYPKFAMWNDGGTQNAYFFTVNLFINNTTFVGVRAFALDRASMLTGGSANAVAFTIPPASLGDSYSLVAATFRTGDPPPTPRDEMLLAIDSPATGGVTQTQVHAWKFHVDFATPANSTLGVDPNHSANSQISVDPFVDAFTSAEGFDIVPQQGTSQKLQTLGDKIMTPLVYHNRSGTESLWADSTICTDANCTGPTGVRWYQFDVTGGNFPATPVQQQTWTNGNDGLWRFMPSIAVDNAGNTAIGYSASSPSIFPGIRYAGRLESDPPSNLGQGEAIMTNGGGAQTSAFDRWGDYTYTSIDPSDGMSFWHVNEYYVATGNASWATRIGKFNFVGGGTPTPTPTATPSTCSWSNGPDLPSAGTRFGGVFFPANGKFYAMGGRDVNNVEFTHPFEYDPVSNSWTTKAATYPDAFVSNTECAVANDSGTDYIYCVGGSSFATQTTLGRVFRYDPVADVITPVATDWPPGDANVLPGGIAAFNNKIYILGGFNVNTSVTDEIWEFTPNPAGWVQKNATLPVPRAYIPTTTIGNFIYTGGGADWDPVGQVLVDTTDSFKYDPVADSITTIASIPRATSNTRAVNFCDQMYVMGGAFNLISNEVDIYDPFSDTWSIGTPFNTARRNAAIDTDGTNNIWIAGGYDSGQAIIASTEIFNCPVSPCGAPTPSPTPTATATATATATVTPSGTPSPSPTSTPRATPRPRPTPYPRPTPP